MTQDNFSTWIASKCAQIRHIEQAAQQCLDKSDTPGYVRCMHDKAQLLSKLAVEGCPLAQQLPESYNTQAVCSRLMRFSQSAAQALQLDSVFYMSALLYPEDHVSGQPNDLEIFAEQFA